MTLTPSKLRADIYRILDRILATGIPIEVSRGRRKLKIVPDDSGQSKLDRLKRRPKAIRGDPEVLVHVDWSKEVELMSNRARARFDAEDTTIRRNHRRAKW
ncbi:MAG: type II toxin-antitoxin system Phd/YefM family antitoxin [Planctomycetes bacterium]|nr:type II toxin-antitoxin system Phd/YefM family antitoxin [Planctomycetota bacterium]